MLLVWVISRIITFILTSTKIIIFIHLSVKMNYFILFIMIILTHNYLLNTPAPNCVRYIRTFVVIPEK